MREIDYRLYGLTKIIALSFIAVAIHRKNRYEIVGLCEISHSIKQPHSSACLKSIKNVSLAEYNAVP